jgi:hypothetical protein
MTTLSLVIMTRESKKKREFTKENERKGKAHQRRNKSMARTTEKKERLRGPYGTGSRGEGGGVFVFWVMAIAAHPA